MGISLNQNLVFFKNRDINDIQQEYKNDRVNQKLRDKYENKKSASTISMFFTLIAMLLLGIAILIVGIIGALMVNMVPVALVGGGLVATKELNMFYLDTMHNIFVEMKTGSADNFIFVVNILEEGLNMLLTLSQLGLIVWDYTFPLVIIVAQIFFDVVVQIFILVMSTPLGDVARQALMMLVEIAIVGCRALAELFTLMADTDVGAGSINENLAEEEAKVGAGTANDYASENFGFSTPSPPDEEAQFGIVATVSKTAFRIIGRFLVRICSLVIRRWFLLIVIFGAQLEPLIDFFFMIVAKTAPFLMKALTVLLKIIGPDSALGKLIFGLLNMGFKSLKVMGATRQARELSNRAACVQKDITAGSINAIRSAIIAITGGSQGIKQQEGCKTKKKTAPAPVIPSNPVLTGNETVGVGACDETVCANDVNNILDIMEIVLPSCSQWRYNDTSVQACMRVVSDYSASESFNIAASKIDTMAKELCFVVVVRIQQQCNMFLPPFGFGRQGVTDDVCVLDKSSLAVSVPPAPIPGETFNLVCSCVFETPICDMDCCKHYAKHVHGQVFDTIGTQTCGILTNQFKDDFWCQFANSTNQNIVPMSDYSFSHVWCNYYRKVIAPLCASVSPFVSLNSLLVLPSMGSAVLNYVTDTCSRTVGVVNVCVKLNTEIDQGIYDMQRARSSTDVGDTFAENLAASAAFVGHTPIVTIPVSTDSIEVLTQKHLNRFFCQHYSIVYNNTNMANRHRPWSLHNYVGRFCDMSVATAIFSFDVQRETGSLLLDSNGEPYPIDLEGIPTDLVGATGNADPSGQSTFGASGQESSTCEFDTGNSPADVELQSECVNAQEDDLTAETVAVGNDAVSAKAQLEANQQTMSQVSHIGSDEPLDPSDPLYAQKLADQQALEAAQNIPVDNWIIQPSATYKDETTQYREINHLQGPTGDSKQENPFFAQLGGRTLKSLNTDKKNRPPQKVETLSFLNSIKEWTQTIDKFEKYIHQVTSDTDRGATNKDIEKWMFNEIKDHDELQLEEDTRKAFARGNMYQLFSAINVRNGRNKYNQFMDMINGEYDQIATGKVAPTESFKRTRSLLSTFIDPAVFDKIAEAVVADGTHPRDLGQDPEAFEAYIRTDSINSMKRLSKATGSVWIPRLASSLFGISSAEEEFVGGAGTAESNKVPGPACRATMSDPYRCCNADATPYECCAGLLGCLPLLPESLYMTVTNKHNLERWRCHTFKGPVNMWVGTTRTVATLILGALNNVTQEVPNSGTTRAITNTLFGWIAYPHYAIPENALGCMTMNLFYLFAGMAIIYAIALLLALQIVTEIIIMVAYKEEDIEGVIEHDNIRKYKAADKADKAAALERRKV